jgi:hypothetical protein
VSQEQTLGQVNITSIYLQSFGSRLTCVTDRMAQKSADSDAPCSWNDAGILMADASAERWIALEAWLIMLDFRPQTIGLARYFFVCRRARRLSDTDPVARASHSGAHQPIEIDGESGSATNGAKMRQGGAFLRHGASRRRGT